MSRIITLFIQSHGLESITSPISLPGVKLLSFVGNVTQIGEMKICQDGQPIDMKVLHYLKDYYSDEYVRDVPSHILFDVLPYYLRSIYRQCGIEYPNGGFRRVYPKNDRTFTLECRPDEDPGLCPEYGITVVHSSDPRDNGFTLCTSEGTINSNINITRESLYHWIEKSPKNKPVLTHISDKIFQDKLISLSEIVYFFKLLGFDEIRIFDPSCRAVEDDDGIVIDPRISRIPTDLRWSAALTHVSEQIKPILKFPTKTKKGGRKSKRMSTRKSKRKSKRKLRKSTKQIFYQR
jgi:hypothetical protein